MRSPRSKYLEEFAALSDDSARYVDVAAQVRVYRRDESDRLYAAEWLPTVYGGRYDKYARRYVGDAQRVHEIKAHPGQIPLITFDKPNVFRVLALGAKGGGKTEGVVATGEKLIAEWPTKPGGVIAPTAPRTSVIWNKFLRALEGSGWVKDILGSEKVIAFNNDATVRFLSAKRQSGSLGSPIAGYDFWWVLEDEQQNIDNDSLYEVDARLRENPDGRVYSTASNEPIVEFQERVQEYRQSEGKEVITFNCLANAFVSRHHWDKLKANWPADEWERIMEVRDVPKDGRVCPAFSVEENIRPVPQLGLDITQKLSAERWGKRAKFIVGTDFGTLKTASILLNAYEDPLNQADRLWWARGELVTVGKEVEWHLDELIQMIADRLEPWERDKVLEKFVMVSIPHVDANQAGKKERTPYHKARQKGIHIVNASGSRISRHHRFSMMDALMHAADGVRRFFVDCDEHRRPACPQLVKSLYGYMLADVGKKDPRYDLSDPYDAATHGVFPFERVRGSSEVRTLRGT